MAADVKIDIAAEFTGKKAFKQAETSTEKLVKSTKKLAGALGLAFAARAITGYGKTAAKAFAEDQKAAQSLTKTLENLSLGFGGSSKEVNDYISNLEQQTGVLDDELRPAMDRLLRATSSITESQKLLSLALDISAGTGRSLTQVSQSLQKAYLGQTQALGRLGVGLSRAELTSGNFEEISARLAVLFEGQAENAASGYAGSIAKLTVATNNASEAIGESLFTAVGTLSGGEGLPKTIALIESFSSGLSNVIVKVSRLARNISIFAAGNPLESIRDLQAATRADQLADAKANANYGGIYADIYKNQVASSAVQKKTLTTSKALTKETAAQLKAKRLQSAIDKANLALNKGQEVFDMDKIQIAAALTSQAEQLGKATTSSQVLQIANDTARLNVKKSILALEDAIAAKDEAAIVAATNKLNTDLKVLGTLGAQNLKLLDIKSLLESLKPKDLINIANLEAALALIGKINLASTGSTKPITPSTVTATGIPMLTDAQVNEALAAGSFVPVVAGTGGVVGGSTAAGAYASSGFPGATKNDPTTVNITVNTGIGDPNAIAEAIDQVITDAVQRGTLKAGTFAA
jgi:hypothetical protein